MVIGVISDTHGLLRPEAVAALRGVEHILHAGDVGDAFILDQLGQIAPVTAIRGNVDRGGRCGRLPETELVDLGGVSLYMLHDGLVHSHHPAIEWRKGVLYFNPGSAGPRRLSLPLSVGFLEISETGIEPRLQTIG